MIMTHLLSNFDKNKSQWVLLIVMFMVSNTGYCSTLTEQRFNEFSRFINTSLKSESISGNKDLTIHSNAVIYIGAYNRLIANLQNTKNWKNSSPKELELLFRAAKKSASGTYDYAFVKDMQGVVKELERRGKVREIYYQELYNVLIETRHFKEALKLSSAHPKLALQPLPKFRDAKTLDLQKPSAWLFDTLKNQLVRENIPLKGDKIIVVSHPTCHFCWNALNSIKSDAELSKYFFGPMTTWLLPQNGEIDIQAIQLMESKFPGIDARLVVYESDWPQIDNWATPIFYFLENGEVVKKIIGWENDKQRTELWETLYQLHFAPDDKSANKLE